MRETANKQRDIDMTDAKNGFYHDRSDRFADDLYDQRSCFEAAAFVSASF